MTSTPTIQVSANRAFQRLIFGLATAYESCPEVKDNGVKFNKDRLDKILHGQHQRIRDGFIEGAGKFIDLLTEQLEEVRKGAGYVEVRLPDDDDDDIEIRDALQLFLNSQIIESERPSRDAFTVEALLVSVASAFEAYCLQILTLLFVKHPRMMPGAPAASLHSILEAKNIAQLIERLSEEAARSQLSGPVETWLRFTGDRLGATLSKKASEWPTNWLNICKLYAYRNCLVHAGGTVDSTLTEKLRRYADKEPAIGTRLNITSDAVLNCALSAADIATKLFFMLCVGQEPRKDQSTAAESVLRIIENLQWHLLEDDLTQIARMLNCTNFIQSTTPTPHHISTWTAQFLLGEREQVAQAVNKYAWPSKDNVLQLHRLALEANTEALKELASKAVADCTISQIAIEQAPHFILIRKLLSKTARE